MTARGLRLYGTLDLLFAALYVAFAIFGPGRGMLLCATLVILAVALAASGAGLLAGARWGRLLGIAASIGLIALAFVVIALLVASAAYLRGVFGGFGAGAALVCLAAAALVVELVALLPLFQLRFLMRDEVRRHLMR